MTGEKKSISWLLISCSFKLLWRLVHIRSHWHSYILSLISRNMFNCDTLLICFYFFPLQNIKSSWTFHWNILYTVDELLFVFWHFKNKISDHLPPPFTLLLRPKYNGLVPKSVLHNLMAWTSFTVSLECFHECMALVCVITTMYMTLWDVSHIISNQNKILNIL